MKKRILIALFALPLVVFLADKALGLNAPATHRNTRASSHLENSEMPLCGLDNPAIVRLENMAPKTKASFLKEFKRWESDEFVGEMQDSFYALDKIYRYESQITDPLELFLQTEVMEPMIEHDVFKIDLEEQFSRCGSQYTFVLRKDENINHHGHGILVKDVGCWERPIAPFEYDLDTRQVWVRVNESLGSLTVNDFLVLYKQALES